MNRLNRQKRSHIVQRYQNGNDPAWCYTIASQDENLEEGFSVTVVRDQALADSNDKSRQLLENHKALENHSMMVHHNPST